MIQRAINVLIILFAVMSVPSSFWFLIMMMVLICDVSLDRVVSALAQNGVLLHGIISFLWVFGCLWGFFALIAGVFNLKHLGTYRHSKWFIFGLIAGCISVLPWLGSILAAALDDRGFNQPFSDRLLSFGLLGGCQFVVALLIFLKIWLVKRRIVKSKRQRTIND